MDVNMDSNIELYYNTSFDKRVLHRFYSLDKQGVTK